MNISAPFIARPVATTLLTAGILLVGVIAFNVLPVSPLPQVDFPTISVSASLPGGSPEITASSIATPLERQFSHIAGITEMTSSSSLGSTSITLQFDLSRDIDGAARDVEAAINAARTYLPANLPANPTYRKVNPADAPIMILGLTSDKFDRPTLYDEASSVMAQKLSQIAGVGQVTVGGGAGPAVRVEVNPTLLNSHGLTLQNVQSVLTQQNAHEPAGQLTDGFTTADIVTNDQISHAEQYKPLIVGSHNGTVVRLSDVADVSDASQNIRAAGYLNGVPSITVVIFRQPGANIIQTVDRIEAELPSIEASIPQGIKTTVVLDRTTTIRASVGDVEGTLVLSVILVILVVFIFLRNWRATLIPTVAVPVSLIGTFAVMYLFGFSIDNLSLMALTISTGFVVDDAIVVMENISRLREEGMPPFKAALEGSREIGFTILSISISLIAVFIPILLMAGIVGRLFREFAITLSTAIVVSMLISLTTTPMMCAYLLKDEREVKHGRLYRASEKSFTWMLSIYSRSLTWVLKHPWPMLAILLLTIGLNFYLIVIIPKGFFPQQDTGVITGSVRGAQDSSFPLMNAALLEIVNIIKADPAVANVSASTGGTGAMNTGNLYIALKPLNVRKITAPEIMDRLRPKLNRLPGPSTFLQAAQDLRIGGRPIHHSVGQRRGSLVLGSDIAGGHAEASGLPGCEQRCTKLRSAGSARLRSPHCGEAGSYSAVVGPVPLQRVRAVGNLHHLYPTEPVLRCAGGSATLLAEPRRLKERLSQHAGQRRRAALGHHLSTDKHNSAAHQSHQFVSVSHDVVQPCREHVAERCHQRGRSVAKAAEHAHNNPGLLCRNCGCVSNLARQRTAAGWDRSFCGLYCSRHSL